MEQMDGIHGQPSQPSPPPGDRRADGVVQRVIETMLLSALMGIFTVGATLWSRSSDHNDAIFRITDTRARDINMTGLELLKLRDYIEAVETRLNKVEDRQRDIELELKVNTANDERNSR